jgi:hypothetical protein
MSADKSDGGVNPKNLWGKPLPNARASVKPATRKPEKFEETVMEDEDQIDVDAELEDTAEPEESDLQDVEQEYVVTDNLYYDGDSVKESDEAPETDETEENLVASGDDEEPDYDDDDDAEDDENNDDGEESDEESEDSYDDDVVESSYDENDGVETETAAPTSRQKTSLVRGNEMAEGKKVTLSDHVRREIHKRKESGASVRGCDIVAALEKRGTGRAGRKPAQAKTGTGAGSGDAPSRVAERKPHAGGVAQAKPQSRPLTKAPPKVAASSESGFQIPMAQLKAAETFVAACGGSFQKAERILTVAAQLSQAFAD